MNELVEVKENENIKDMIYEIRGVEVILDSDLAKLYNVETKRINEAVSRNKEKFPERFSFKLIEKETRGGRYKNPRVFTEHGVTMLATILKSKEAIEETIKIIDAFVAMRRYLSNISIEQKGINKLVLENSDKLSKIDTRLNLIEETLSSFKEKNNHLFFKNQLYDAHSLLIDILNKSKNEIIIIDNYIDKNILDILKDTNKDIVLVTNKYNNTDYNKYKKQYSNITLKIENSIHDRFIIIDKKVLYHCGASFKDLAKKCFCISKINNNVLLNDLINRYDL